MQVVLLGLLAENTSHRDCHWLVFLDNATQLLRCPVQLEMLVPLESLLEHDSLRVQTYANAILYSLLRSPRIRYNLLLLVHAAHCSVCSTGPCCYSHAMLQSIFTFCWAVPVKQGLVHTLVSRKSMQS